PLIARASRDSRISIDSAAISRSAGARVIANSLGMRASDSNTTINWYVMGMAIAGEEITSFDNEGDFSYFDKDLDAKIEKTADDFAARVLACLGASKMQGYKGKILLNPSLTSEFLLDSLVYH
ncbi:MAG: hypothetical protein HQL31_07945, partial [Planctomycetes bacterium]|nr:hypothetical protein [Planctomycetota bacterium]